MKLPYLPDGREIKYVPLDHPLMREAKIAREQCAGDPLYPVGAILVRDGEILCRAGNGYNRGSGEYHICPRVVEECPSGTGYDRCSLHDSPGHAEAMLMKTARQQGIDPAGADVYLCGHWWCCEPCWQVMIAGGVRDVYLAENAEEIFHRDRVYAEALTPEIKKVGVFSNQDWVGAVCTSLGLAVVPMATEGCDAAVVDLDSSLFQLEKMKAGIPVVCLSQHDGQRAPPKDLNVVYLLHYESPEEARRKLPLILRQM